MHALTDVTGFGLAGHALEVARGAHCDVYLRWPNLPLLPGVLDLAEQGIVTGASGRNWASCGGGVRLAPQVGDAGRALLTDPQTSGGLLVSCSPEEVTEVLSIFLQQGFTHVSVIGEMQEGEPGIEVN